MILWFYIKSVQPSPSTLPLLLPLLGQLPASTPPQAPPPTPPTPPTPPIPLSPLFLPSCHFGEERKKGSRWKMGVQLLSCPWSCLEQKALQVVQLWFCFLPPLGELRILSHNASTKLLHCSKKALEEYKASFCTKSVKGLPAKFKGSGIKSVLIEWEHQHQSQVKNGHSMSSWDCLVRNVLSTFFIPFAWNSFFFELQTACMFGPEPIPTKISGCFLTN